MDVQEIMGIEDSTQILGGSVKLFLHMEKWVASTAHDSDESMTKHIILGYDKV